MMLKRFELCRALRSAGLAEYAEKIVRAADALEVALRSESAVDWMDGVEALRSEAAAGVVALEGLVAGRGDGLEV